MQSCLRLEAEWAGSSRARDSNFEIVRQAANSFATADGQLQRTNTTGNSFQRT